MKEATRRYVVEVLYADRCQRLPSTIDRVRRALRRLAENDADVELRLVRIADLAPSPIVRLNGKVVPPDFLGPSIATA